ncbi:AfsR/SARP family transcriptional regulator [Actinospica robiniae]|uniref:AfsR/SARP family transcriptional regulator n=1 Tax=Actinospica robiniae TaxID=304901 RepID=UPI0003FBF873|nr:AfsR/SARP family transcriptional regulator [Actinospica robiniae]
MRFALLGPVRVTGVDGPLEINGTLRRTLLAALLLRANEVVSADQLADLLWGDQPRPATGSPLHNQVTRLRQALGSHGGRIRAVPPGYVVDVGPGELDTAEFSELCDTAAKAAGQGDWATSAQEYTAALALWRGEPFADVPALQTFAAVEQFAEERLLALQGRIEADLQLSRHDQVIGELRTLIAAHPWREAFHAQLMLALYRSGRQLEALDVYRDLRRAVADAFGVEPGNTIRSLHDRILRSDATLTPPTAVLPPARARQLPADTRAFTGREAELDTLIAAARGEAETDAAPTVVISAINGMGGIGKTALAIRAAHRLVAHYPDGQLFIDLHGHSADLDPIAPPDALDYLLRSLGVEPRAIPQDPHERAALYRTKLTGTRTLIVLDNARGPAQIKPLIPAEPGCLVLVTSRNLLTGLDDAEFLSLDSLPPAEAVALLAAAAGPGRMEVHDPAAAELVELCGRLPLAIRMLGARLRHRPKLSLKALLATLQTGRDPLALLKDDDRDITRVFASSLDVLPEAQQRLFARLGLIPGPDFDALAAAALEDIDVAEAERRLESLYDHSLLIQHTEGRYRFHDLLRAYARTRAAEGDPVENQAATERLLDYYVETAASANAAWFGRPAGPRPVGRVAPAAAGAVDAKGWFAAESAALLAVVESESVEPRRKFELAKSMTPYLHESGPWDRFIALQLARIEIARAEHDISAEAAALRVLGNSYNERGMSEEAVDCLQRAIEAFRTCADLIGEAHALRSLGHVLSSRHANLALEYTRQAERITQAVGSPFDHASVLNVLSILANHHGRFEDTVEHSRMMIELGPQMNDRFLEANAHFHLGHAMYALGRFDEIEPCHHAALKLLMKSEQFTASFLQELGRLRMMQNRYAEATEYLEQALQSFAGFRHALGLGYARGELGRIRLRLGDPEAAMALQQSALKISLDSRQSYLEAFIRTNIGHIHIANGQFDAADEQLRSALELSVRGGFMFSQVEVRVGICALIFARDGAAAALAHYREAVEFARKVRHPRELASALVGLGRCELETGAQDSGVAHLNEAIDLYHRMGATMDEAETRAHLPASEHDR